MTATLLTVDAGSSSVKLAAYELQGAADGRSIRTKAPTGAYRAQPPRCFAHAQAAPSTGSRPAASKSLLKTFVDDNAISGVRAVAHRIVHGGMNFSASRIVDDAAQRALRGLTELAPLHMPIALDWMKVCRAMFGRSVVQIGVFDTAFFADLPAVARHYAMPLELQRTHGVRRFGFHGLAHASMLRQVQALRPDLDRGGRLVTIQLGAGCSMAAIKHGEPLDTSMGFSPLEGLVMATRAGDIDAGLLTFLERRAGFTAESLERVLNTESGLLGVSGLSADMRALLGSRSPDSELAIELYCYRARKYIGSYLAVLGGADVIAIGGGVGEHSPEIRERILAGLEWCGVSVDRDKNAAARGTDDGNARISDSSGSVDVRVIAVDEGAEMAREAIFVLDAIQPRRSQRQPLSST
jgi:acetate kinase